MTISKDKKIWYVEPSKKLRDKIAINVPKGKRDVYRRAAAELGLSLSVLIQKGVEEFISNNVDEDFVAKIKAEEKLSKEKQKLIAAFDKLPKDSQKIIRKLVEDFASKISPVN